MAASRGRAERSTSIWTRWTTPPSVRPAQVKPKFISPVGSRAQWTGANKGSAFFAYATNYLIDLDHAVIVDVEASTAVRPAEVTAACTMIERAQERFGLWPERLAADSAYGSAENARTGWSTSAGSSRTSRCSTSPQREDGTFSRADFAYDHAADLYRCPAGKELKQHRRGLRIDHPRGSTGRHHALPGQQGRLRRLRSQAALLPRHPGPQGTRSIHEGARDMARDIAKTDAYVTSRRQRKKVEMLFAHLKRILRLDRLRLRGPNGARDEFLLAATAQNLRKLAKLVPVPAPALA